MSEQSHQPQQPHPSQPPGQPQAAQQGSSIFGVLEDAQKTPSGKRRWWQWMLVYPAFFGAMIGAIPTGLDLYKSFKYDVKVSNVKHAEEQRRLWIKNFKCTQEMTYQSVRTTDGVNVQVGACKNGDVLIEVQPPQSDRIVEWVSIDRLKSSAFGSLLTSPAYAATLQSLRPAAPVNQSPIRLAQATAPAQAQKPICQRLLGGTKIRRIVKQGNKCFSEEVELLKGKVVNRKEVSCTAKCQ